jgi:hypothetical protein
MSDSVREPALGGSSSTLKSIPRQRLPMPIAEGGPGLRGRLSPIWKRYLGLAVSADPCLTTVWIHGQCLDVSIYDRDWPESYRY